MRRGVLVGLGLAGLAAAGVATSRLIGSRPDEPGFDGPLPLCPNARNCFRARTTFAAAPEAVRTAALDAVRQHDDLLTGRALRVTPTELGLTAVFRSGPFRDDVAIAVTPGPDAGSTLHVRSAARVGESDLGVNRMRARRLLAEIEERLTP